MRHLALLSERPRLAGTRRFAASSSAPTGLLGGEMCAVPLVGAEMNRRGAMRWQADRDHRALVVSKSSKSSTSSTSIGRGYQPIDPENKSAGFSRRDRTQ
jgi:hypothetical protein